MAYGVPKSIDIWVSTFYENLMNLTKHMISVGKEQITEEIRTVDGKYKEPSYGLVFKNEDYFDSSVVFSDNEIKIKGLQIRLESNTLPNKYKDNISKYWNAHYIQNDDAYIDEYGFLIGSEIMFNIFLPEEIFDVKDIDQYMSDNYKSDLTGYISHELTHMYEFYKKAKKGKFTWDEIEENYINNLMGDYLVNTGNSKLSESWNKLLQIIYLSSGFEVNARISQIYYYLKNHKREFKNHKEYWDIIKQTTMYDDLYTLKEFDVYKWYNNFKYNEDLVDDYLSDDPIYEFSEEEKEKYNKKELLIRSLIQDWSFIVDRLISNGIDLERVPDQYKEDPMLFLNDKDKKVKKYSKKYEEKIERLYNNFIN